MKKQLFWLGLAALFFGEVGAAQRAVYDWPTILGEEAQYFETPANQQLFYFNTNPEFVFNLSEFTEIEKRILKKNIEQERLHAELLKAKQRKNQEHEKELKEYRYYADTLENFLLRLSPKARPFQGETDFYDSVLAGVVKEAKEKLRSSFVNENVTSSAQKTEKK